MRITFTVRDGRGGHPDAEVLLDADATTRMREVVPALAAALGEEVHPTFASRLQTWVDGRRCEPEESLFDAGVREGSLVSLYADAGPPLSPPHGVAEVRVAGGPGAGRVHRLALGRTTVGCGADGFSLPDVRVPAAGLSLLARPDGSVEIELAARQGSRAADGGPGEAGPSAAGPSAAGPGAAGPSAAGPGATLDGEPLAGPVPWPRGACLRIGDTVLHLLDPERSQGRTSRAADGAGIEFHRPPRLLPARHPASVTMPGTPVEPARRAFPWLVVAAPMLLAVPMAVLSSPRFLIFALMSPLMMLANVVNDRRTGRREHRTRVQAHQERLRTALADRRRLLLEEEHRRREDAPDPAAVLLTALGPGRQLWQRRRRDDDYLVLRVGLADRPAQLSVVLPPGTHRPGADRAAADEAALDEGLTPPVARDVPVTVDLRRLGVLGIAGDPDLAQAEASWLVAQACVLHSPRDLRVVLLAETGGAAARRWDWVRRLPHARPDELSGGADGDQAGRPVVLIGNDQESVARRVAELTTLVTQRLAERATATGSRTATPAPDLVVVLDGARRLRTLPGVAALLRDGPTAGVQLICLEDEERALPEECQAVVACGAGRLALRETKADTVGGITPDAVEPAWVAQVARALAPLRDADPDHEDAALPSAVRLLDCLRLDPPDPQGVLERWRAGGTTGVVVGAGFDGAFRLDLRRDGPHALVAGTTGAGKSEFLQTLVASLAVANPPDALTFVLVDYKGGSAFRECARLPHTVGMVTDLDAHLVSRALESLGAELKRRERLLAGAGAKDLEDYLALRGRDATLPAVPRLVLVIDEFAGLVSELPDFVPGLVGIAQRGRSLGIHLVLATQRPTGVVSPEIRANTALRICLRVTDDAESRDVIDAPEAAWIPRGMPGRGLARTGHASLLPFQSGRVGGRRPERVGTASAAQTVPPAPPLLWVLPWQVLGGPAPQRPRAAGSQTDEGDTDLSDLVTAVRSAARSTGVPVQPSPWLPPLPTTLLLSDLAEANLVAATAELGAAWALADLPAEQAQRPCVFRLGASGHLYVVGGPRSGRTTALRTLITGLAGRASAADLHVYGLDCGSGGLHPLAGLPHCAAVVPRTATERADRLLRRIRDEVTRRQDLLAAGGYADLAEQRAAVPPDQRLPFLVLAIDRWEGFATTLGELDGGRLADDVMGLLREGASAGLHLLVSGDRSLLLGRIGALVERKLLLRLPDRNDYALAGVPVRDVPEHLPPGRGVWADGAVEVQVAVLSPDTGGNGQAAAVEALAREASARDAHLAARLRPSRLGTLPTIAEAAPLLGRLAVAVPPMSVSPMSVSPVDGRPVDGGPDGRPVDGLRSRLWVPFGVGGDELALFGLDLELSPVAVVAGPPRSGRTGALRFALAAAARRGCRVLAVCPRGGALADQALAAGGPASVFVGTGSEPGEPATALVERLRGLPTDALVLVDDAEMVREGELAPALLAITRQAREKRWGVVVAGDTAQLVTGLSGWLFEARRARQGLLLSPRNLGDGEVLGTRLARSQLVTRTLPGRGLLVGATEEPLAVQVPLVDGG